eukprot:ctg_325.g95
MEFAVLDDAGIEHVGMPLRQHVQLDAGVGGVIAVLVHESRGDSAKVGAVQARGPGRAKGTATGGRAAVDVPKGWLQIADGDIVFGDVPCSIGPQHVHAVAAILRRIRNGDVEMRVGGAKREHRGAGELVAHRRVGRRPGHITEVDVEFGAGRQGQGVPGELQHPLQSLQAVGLGKVIQHAIEDASIGSGVVGSDLGVRYADAHSGPVEWHLQCVQLHSIDAQHRPRRQVLLDEVVGGLGCVNRERMGIAVHIVGLPTCPPPGPRPTSGQPAIR